MNNLIKRNFGIDANNPFDIEEQDNEIFDIEDFTKIYLYDPDTGELIGEGFGNFEELDPNTTTVAPPLFDSDLEIVTFDENNNSWGLKNIKTPFGLYITTAIKTVNNEAEKTSRRYIPNYIEDLKYKEALEYTKREDHGDLSDFQFLKIESDADNKPIVDIVNGIIEKHGKKLQILKKVEKVRLIANKAIRDIDVRQNVDIVRSKIDEIAEMSFEDLINIS